MSKQLRSNTEYTAYAVLLVAAILFSIGWIASANLGLLLLFSFGLHTLHKQVVSPQAGAYIVPKAFLHPLWLVVLALGLVAAIYRPQAFSYPLAWRADELYPGGEPFALYINLSKAIGGYLILVYFFRWLTPPDNAMRLSSAVFVSIGATMTLLLIACLVFDVAWQPKLASGVVAFILVNLLVSVLSEEAFFRLLIQRYLRNCFSNDTVGMVTSVLLATTVFTLAHTAKLGPAFALYFIAGLVYSLVYAITQRFYLAVTVHFGTNLLHFILLEYPLKF